MFELHITVSALSEEDIPAFVAFSRSIKAKPIIIELDKGECMQQPMISKIYKDIEPGSLKGKIEELVNVFEESGFHPIRVKVEVPLSHLTEGEAEFPDYRGQYFEWHGKVKAKDFEELNDKLRYSNAHLSRNSLKGEKNRRFLTIRNYSNKHTFLNIIESFKKFQLDTNRIKLVKEVYEYCVYDSNKAIDKGWSDTPVITDYHYLNMLAFEGFLRRTTNLEQPFILKGSLLTRQCISDKNLRMARDLDFLYGTWIDNENEASEIFSEWVTKVTEEVIDDGIHFRSFQENDFWRGIDYAMDDDFPTTNTDLYCKVKGQVIEALGLDITWNLPLDEEPEPLIYHPIEGEPFIIPYTVPVPVQISWKLHQSVVRPRAKDFIDIIMLLEDNNLDDGALQRVAFHYVNECKKDKIDPKRLDAYTNGQVSSFCKKNQISLDDSLDRYWPKNTGFGFVIGHHLSLRHLDAIFKMELPYETPYDLIEHFEETLKRFQLDEYLKKLLT